MLVAQQIIVRFYFYISFIMKTFIWTTLGFDKKYRIRYNKIKRLWLGDVFQVDGDYVGFKKPECITKYEVKIGDYSVRYFKDKHSRNVFLASEKYKTMVKWYETFSNQYK